MPVNKATAQFQSDTISTHTDTKRKTTEEIEVMEDLGLP